ncbi:MAG: SO_0444 family Cu/Zn efflux transporter [bacterium]|nr:SO_0444 family Cu/Zn efflux transporter [bacterium]
MLRFFLDIFQAFLNVLIDSSPYLLFGFFIAGLIHVYLPAQKVLKYLGKGNFRSVLNASLLGLPLPLCSCAVLPTAISLRKQGASKGSIFSFLISTPESSVTAIGISLALLDPLMTVFRPIAAFVTALLTGIGVNVFDRRGDDRKDVDQPLNCDSCNCGDAGTPNDQTTDSVSSATNHKLQIKKALNYSFGELLNDLAPYLLIGLLAAGLIATVIPDDFFTGLMGQGIWPMIVMILIGIPLYVCAEASTPIAAALLLKGLSPGAALVFMLAGPATNIGSLIVLSRYFSKKTIAIYLAGIAILSLVFGLILNQIYSSFNLNVRATLGAGVEFLPGWVKISAALLFGGLMLRSLIRTKYFQTLWERVRQRYGWSSVRVRNLLIAAALLIYLSDCFFAVPVGNTGMIVSLGKVVSADLAPGLHLRLPVPFAKTLLVDTQRVRSFEFGFRRTTPTYTQGNPLRAVGLAGSEEKLDVLLKEDHPEESELFGGDENLIDIDVTVFYTLVDAYKAVYSTQDIEAVVREIAASKIMGEIAARQVEDGLTGDWTDFENQVKTKLQADLNRLGIGVEIKCLNLVYAHAPEVVHAAYRDVASALEDKYRLINLAEADSITNLANARARANSMLFRAQSDSAEQIMRARGDADRFLAMAKSTKVKRAEQQFRLNAQVAETTLVNLEKILTLTRNSPGLDLIVIPKTSDPAQNLPPEVLERLTR